MLRTIAGLTLVTACLAVPCGAMQSQSEYTVKAAFIYNFCKYIEYPRGSISGDFVIGIVGKNPFGSSLEEITRGKSIGGHAIKVKKIDWDDIGEAHVLFVSASESEKYDRLSRISRNPIVTIGETIGFAKQRGMIGFRVENQRVAFDINPGRAKAGGISFSSRLLQLAQIVKG